MSPSAADRADGQGRSDPGGCGPGHGADHEQGHGHPAPGRKAKQAEEGEDGQVEADHRPGPGGHAEDLDQQTADVGADQPGQVLDLVAAGHHLVDARIRGGVRAQADGQEGAPEDERQPDDFPQKVPYAQRFVYSVLRSDVTAIEHSPHQATVSTP